MEAGDRVDRYELLARLGEGAQGEVWTAHDPLSGDLVALKLMRRKHASDEALERGRREARTLAKLDHPSLCHCHSLFEDLEKDVLGFAMDFVDGESLDEAATDERLTSSARQHIAFHLAGALAHFR